VRNEVAIRRPSLRAQQFGQALGRAVGDSLCRLVREMRVALRGAGLPMTENLSDDEQAAAAGHRDRCEAVARVVDAQVVDAQVVDAQVVDAQVMDAQVVDAQVMDAQVRPGRAPDDGCRTRTMPPPTRWCRRPVLRWQARFSAATHRRGTDPVARRDRVRPACYYRAAFNGPAGDRPAGGRNDDR
jgi:hypothetical protein